MSTPLTTEDLLFKCREIALKDPTKEHLDHVIEDAIQTSSREIANLGGPLPMAWNRETYDEIFTRYYATISAITIADPGVITAESIDPDLSSDHGFQNDDFVYIDGIAGPTRLNRRIYRATRVSATKLTLQTLDDQDDISTSGYEAWTGGGTIYHVGLVLPSGTIIPSDDWTINRVWDVNFDKFPGSKPITEERVIAEDWLSRGGRPERWRYQKYTYSDFTTSNIEHWLFWYGLPGSRYNVEVKLEKTYPDITTFDNSTYPPHPIELHDYIWHRALANLATQTERARRGGVRSDGTAFDNTKIEIVNAQYWIAKAASDEIDILAYNRSLLGDIPHSTDSMSA